MAESKSDNILERPQSCCDTLTLLVPTPSNKGEGDRNRPPGIRITTSATNLKLWEALGVS